MKPEPNTDTPETEAKHHEVAQMDCSDLYRYRQMQLHARRMERERDEARLICRWAFPRLGVMCHDFDATGTGLCCAEEMESHPEIFGKDQNQLDSPPLIE